MFNHSLSGIQGKNVYIEKNYVGFLSHIIYKNKFQMD